MADDGVVIGKAEAGPIQLRLDKANRHGLVAGATGTGKTVTLQVLAEGFAAAGVPVFAADVKGDLSGIAAPATLSDKLNARAQALGVTIDPKGAPTLFWDVFRKEGHPVRTTISEMGPILLSRLMELSEAEEGVLTIAFHVADKDGLLLLDMDDLQAMLVNIGENAKAIGLKYGHVAPASIGTIQRKLLTLRSQGADNFFAEPALQLADLMRTDRTGRGYVSVLAADQLIENPRLYSTFLLWLLSELFEELPEAGDLDRPKLVFFFDEAHLLFRDAPKPLLEKVEQVVRLVRSKGVGIYFVTQNPADIPETVLAQLGNRIQHALRAYTPSEQEGLRAASKSFRPNPAFDTAEAIQNLGVGEALVSVLDEKGAPTVVERTLVRPPNSRIGPVNDLERQGVIASSPVAGLYDTAVNRESAYELLAARAEAKTAAAAAATTAVPTGGGLAGPGGDYGRGPPPRSEPRYEPAPRPRAPARPRPSNRQSMGETLAKQVLRTAGSTITRELLRGLLGGMRRR
jgi:DNA double-strand break repair helicase HerA and related ATPase